MANRKKHWYQKLINTPGSTVSWLRSIVSGSLYRVSDVYNSSAINDIKSQIDTMRALAKDSQISTSLSYYATDATTLNTAGQVIWATADTKYKDVADIINTLFKNWKINSYARDHILELATIGNLYIPTTRMYRDNDRSPGTKSVALDNNTIPDPEFNIVPSYQIPPEDIVHIYLEGDEIGYMVNPDDRYSSDIELHPPQSCIHFSLGGMLGKYTIDVLRGDVEEEYDIKFAQPLMERATQPTQTLGLLEDALLLSSLIRNVKFINVECGNAEEEEIQSILQQIKDAIEQQLALNTASGSAESFVNPQSPNNLIYLPKINGTDPISVTDLNMSDATQEDSKLLEYYQDKKLSVLGVPKEAMNFSSNEGLGGAGSVLSQRSALYANSLQRLKSAYIEGWTEAINMYFRARGMSGFVDKFTLHMTEVVTEQSTITFEKRDAAISQAQQIVDLMKNCGIANAQDYKSALTEILTEVLPITGGKVNSLGVNVKSEGGESGESF